MLDDQMEVGYFLEVVLDADHTLVGATIDDSLSALVAVQRNDVAHLLFLPMAIVSGQRLSE